MILKPFALLFILVSAAGCIASPAALPQEEAVVVNKRVWLSNVDVNEACKQQHGRVYYASAAGGVNCGAWRCYEAGGNIFSIDMNRYCVNRHPHRPGVYASCYMTPNDWQCHDNA
ncbi:hypothetical protein CVT24_005557 [Panaeolus cyanescens]|uniref:Lipoprotein n=1 Tax=Panaeolus cyanescens TaxID=181874 RepID=A0A409XAM9_9AGAR|nr:hypothetical protein CVT24_005557 [Panaeolus cyanescens]